MKALISLNIVKLNEDEEFMELPRSICDTYKISHSRYLISNYSRIYDTSTEGIILAYPAKAPYFLLRTLSNTMVLVHIGEIHQTLGYQGGGCLNVIYTRELQSKMVAHRKSISDCCILDRDLVFYIRYAYYSKEKNTEELLYELGISRFSLGFAVNDNFIKFENSCEIRDNDLSMTLEFMEAIDTITSANSKLRIKTVTQMICNKMGIEFNNNLYNKAANYYGGRCGYCYIPRNVQRLVE